MANSFGIVFALLLFGLSTTAKAQGYCDAFGASDLTANGGWSTVVDLAGEASVLTATADFHIKVSSTGTTSTFYLHRTGTDIDQTPTAAVRVNAGGALQVYNYDRDLQTYSWECNGTCPTVSAGQWYRIRMVYEIISGYVDVEYSLCGGTLAPLATDFYVAQTTLPRRTQYYAIHSSGVGVTAELHQMTYTRSPTPAPNCADNGQLSCVSPRECVYQGLTYTACDATTPSPFCTNQVEQVGAARPTSAYATTFNVYGGGADCSGVIIGPHSVLTARHCLVEQDYYDQANLAFANVTRDGTGTANWETWTTGNGLWIVPDSNPSLTFYATRVVATEFPGTWNTPSNDSAIIYTRGDPLPTPYITEIFDPATDAANCDDMLLQGHPFGVPTMSERQMQVLYWQAPGAIGRRIYGWVMDPGSNQVTGGDSGGPLYAIGDWDGAGPGTSYPKLVANVGGGHGWSGTRYALPQASWINSNIDAPASALLTVGAGIDIDDFWLDRDFAVAHDISASPLTVPCHIKATASLSPIEYAGCRFVAPNGKRKGCVDRTEENGEYSCEVTLPAGTVEWAFERVFFRTEAGEIAHATMIDLGRKGIHNIQSLNLSNTATDSTYPGFLTGSAAPAAIAPGGDAVCAYRVSDNQTGLRATGCVYSDGTGCVGGVPFSAGGITFHECSVEVPADTTPGTSYSMSYAFAQDNVMQSKRNYGSWPAATVFDCAEATAAQEVIGAGSLGNQAIDTGGYGAVFEFFARPSSTTANGKIFFSDQTITTGEAESAIGVRFDSAGFVNVLDNRAWSADVPYPYTAGTWYQVRILVEGLTYPQNAGGNTYSVSIAPCGSGFTEIASAAVLADGSRLYSPITAWDIFADAGQTLGVHNVAGTEINCLATQCTPLGFAFEPWDCGTNIPNGCGGTIAYCGAVGGNLDCGDGAGGLECINYVCQ